MAKEKAWKESSPSTMLTHVSSTCKAGRGWDRQLGLPATSVAGEGARSHVELVVSSLASDMVATYISCSCM